MFSRSIVKAVIFILGGVIAAYFIFWDAPSLFNRKQVPGSVEHMNSVAAQLNRSLPSMLDQETELTTAEGAYRMLIYKYRLINVPTGRLDYQRFAADAKPKLTQAACTNAATREDFLSKGISLRYSYFDKDKNHIATIDVTPKDCGL